MSPKNIALIFLFTLMLTENAIATPPSGDIFTRVENPEHYELLASRQSILQELFVDWPILSITVNMGTSRGIVAVVVALSVPIDTSSIGIAYTYDVVMRFHEDTLLNKTEIRKTLTSFRYVVSHIESHKVLQVFHSNVELHSANLQGTENLYSIELLSTTGDTLIYRMAWDDTGPLGSLRKWTVKLCFTQQGLLDQLESFLSRCPVPQIREFRTQVGISYARFYKNRLFVSSGRDCSDFDACFSAMRSMNFVTSFKLPTTREWHSFPYYPSALSAVQEYLATHADNDCVVDRSSSSAFVVSGYQQNSNPRRVYVPLACKGNAGRVASVRIDIENTSDSTAVIHTRSVLDSLKVECPWK
ncbi:MAG: hypothetical protein DRP45_07100 [Candidatus Zixiibacteriota bacterium]|nr:MAG: hypothetical protein DRP45_07100 [candidate division Zixibacteria bacterium]